MPSWNIKVTGIAPLLESWEEGDDLAPVRDGVVSRVKEAVGYSEGDDLELDEALANLEEAKDQPAFDEAMMELYDWADKARVWIDPIN